MEKKKKKWCTEMEKSKRGNDKSNVGKNKKIKGKEMI